MRQAFDYVIIGAGSAGCTLANRLAQDAGVSVLLLEAGGWDRDPLIHIPLGWGRILQKRLHDWMYFAEPSDTMNRRRIECARGKIVGGPSSINAMAHYHGHRADYDRWASSGLPNWSYAHVLPYFRRVETWEGCADAYRGIDGLITTRYSRFEDPLCDAILAAAKAAGYPMTSDYNGAYQEGFARMQMALRKGRRCSAASAYLRPAMNRRNLTVQVSALVTRIKLEGSRATGVEHSKDGKTFSVRAEREVILAAGAINSPQILMLSGIGSPQELRVHGISTCVPLPGVGANLQDHASAGIGFRRRTESPFHRNMRVDRLIAALAKAALIGEGFAADLPLGITAFLRTRKEQSIPDVQLLFWMGATSAVTPYLPPFKKAFDDTFFCRAMLLRPASRGTVKLSSKDPGRAPLIYQDFLGTDDEWRTMRAGLRMIREIVAVPSLAPLVEQEVAPGPSCVSDADLDRHIRSTMITVHHPVGTCKMGPKSDPMAVVDQELRVHGIDSLRVIDGAVMPDLIGGATNAPIIMIAEKAADLLRGRTPLAPAHIGASGMWRRDLQ